MTPQLQQSIKMLQMSNIELASFVDQELERNPLLDSASDGDDRRSGEDGWDAGGGAMPSDQPAVREPTDSDADFNGDWTEGAAGDSWWHDSDAGAWRRATGGGGGDMPDNLEQTANGPTTLRDHLVGQLNVDILDVSERLIGLHLIEQLDEAGYVPAELEPIAARLGCSQARLHEVLARMQSFDPAGIFARDLSECLALQLRERDRFDPAMQTLLRHLPLVAKRDTAALVRLCGVDREDIADMIAELKSLNPKPAAAFEHAVMQPITPDILMRPRADGGWHIELNTETLPRVLVNQRYYAQVQAKAASRADREFISECLQTANWLTKALHQRAQTILKVATELVRQQDAFFRHGVSALRPLILRDIADAISMHESTVSRVTTNKYIATQRGIFELKYFFTTSIGSTIGDDTHSSESVRHRIKALIAGEPADAVLSDNRIVTILQREGIEIARRTVAKYREAMRIPPSTRRRQEKSENTVT